MELASSRASRHKDFLDALRRISQAIRLSSQEAEASLGITGAQLLVLQKLAESPAASLRELAGRTLTDESSVSVVVGRLVRRRYIARRPSRGDARRVELSLTTAGRALLGRAPEVAQTRLVAALERVPPAQLHGATRVLDRLAREMGSPSGAPAMFLEPPPPARRRGSR